METTTLFGNVTTDMFSGVLDGVIELLPIVLPVVVGFLAFRKGFGFLMGCIKKA